MSRKTSRKTPHPSAAGSRTPALLVFAAIFAALWLVHLPLLRLPYFWDEAGYFIPAARDILLTGDLIPHTTLSNAHPPLVMLWLALCWKLTAYSPLVTRTAMLLVASFGFTGLWLLGRYVASAPVATATVVLTALSPTVFSQSVMAQLDIAAFALVLWTLYSHIRGRYWQAVAFAALAGGGKGDHGGRHAHFGRSGLAGVVRLPIASGDGRAVASATAHARAHSGNQRGLPAGAAAAGRLVCVSLPPHRPCLRQSRLPALQRGSHGHAAAHSAGGTDAAVARDRIHEPFRADRSRAGVAVERASARRCRSHPASLPALRKTYNCCWPGGAGASGGVFRRRRCAAGALHDPGNSAGGAAGGGCAAPVRAALEVVGRRMRAQRFWLRCSSIRRGSSRRRTI